MFTFDNNHIFTGYLKQVLASTPIPACRVYTQEFIRHKAQTGKEDPRVIMSTAPLGDTRPAMNICYVKDNSIAQYKSSYDGKNPTTNKCVWSVTAPNIFEDDRVDANFTKVLKSTSRNYDTATHEYLGDYLRFLRDYNGINLMSLYNCFNNKVCSNISFKVAPVYTKTTDSAGNSVQVLSEPGFEFNSFDQKYKIYAFPVKLFEKYTIAIDSPHGFEICCGFYKTKLDRSDRGMSLIKKTYFSTSQAIFSQPILYTNLDVSNWEQSTEFELSKANNKVSNFMDESAISRLDVAIREQTLTMFLKVPASCRSSITILEGDYRRFNDSIYTPQQRPVGDGVHWQYEANHYIVNCKPADRTVDINTSPFVPISKVQLLEFNTGISYPFADRLVEYLVGSAITPKDEIPDNIQRTQAVMNQNGIYFKIDGLWENKMRKLLYDQVLCAGPFELGTVPVPNMPEGPITEAIQPVTNLRNKSVVLDKREGRAPSVGHNRKSMLYDVLGYVDKDAEKFYASWKAVTQKNKDKPSHTKVVARDTIHSVNIYNELYDIK